MQESREPRVSDQLGSTSQVDLDLTPAEIQMDTWKPDATNSVQLFQDFDNVPNCNTLKTKKQYVRT